MKYLYRWLYTSVFLLMLALPQWVGAQTLRPEQITRFDVVATINKDRRITVEETIEYDFGSQFRHGIYRYIPTGYDRNGGRYYLLLDLVSVTQDGNKAIYTKTKNPNETNLKIGEGDKTITGKHTYVIRYNVNRALNDFPDEDVVEWYWNVTGNGWNVPILSSSLTMRGPVEAGRFYLFYRCLWINTKSLFDNENR
ncbi:MAG: DUF2207 domain-containing protein [Candidatus Nomurabacteria bacterium]|nr:MAG: DUF2207 domain-containing protein [Candidatus Nomurabacteria bacterium]